MSRPNLRSLSPTYRTLAERKEAAAERDAIRRFNEMLGRWGSEKAVARAAAADRACSAAPAPGTIQRLPPAPEIGLGERVLLIAAGSAVTVVLVLVIPALLARFLS